MRLFISGPVTGMPSWKLQRFEFMADKLMGAGYQVSVPTRMVEPMMEHAPAMRICLSELLRCDGVALLPGWRNSEGCNIEVSCAIACGMEVMFAESWLERGISGSEDREGRSEGQWND